MLAMIVGIARPFIREQMVHAVHEIGDACLATEWPCIHSTRSLAVGRTVLEKTPQLSSGCKRSQFLLCLPFQKNVPRRDGIVVNLIVGRIYERERTLPCEQAQLAQKSGIMTQLVTVAAAEFLPTSQIVPEPFL